MKRFPDSTRNEGAKAVYALPFPLVESGTVKTPRSACRRLLFPAFCALLPLLAAVPAQALIEESFVYQSATMCRECHPEIYRTWRSSQHATSFTDPTFQLPYDRVRKANPGKALPCERCHNPMRFLLDPEDPRSSIFALEGVTCDLCHTVETVRVKESVPRFVSRPGIRFGPRGKEVGKSFHATRFSPFLLTSEFCAGCHEFRNGYGVEILATYSEWADSFYRGEGVHCQFCHLPQIFDASFIDKKSAKGPSDHAMVGGHSRERLSKAIKVRASMKVSGGEARLTIYLKNEFVGHKTPTGIPSHRIRMTSTLYDAAGNVLAQKEEIFERRVGDGTGKPLERPEEIFTAAREVLMDNRIKPKETRRIDQAFELAGARPASAEVALAYEIPTADTAIGLRHVEIPVTRVVIPARTGVPALYAALIALAAALLLLAAVYLLRRRTR